MSRLAHVCLPAVLVACLAAALPARAAAPAAAKEAAPAPSKAATSAAPSAVTPSVPRATGKTPPASPIEAATQIDQLLAKDVFANKSGSEKLAARTDDETFLRRVTLDITGETPSPEEVTRFALDPSALKRSQAVERLLSSQEYGRNWALYWRDVIFSRRTEERALLGMSSATSYLTDEFNKNTAWDKLARTFITATGDVREVGSTAIVMSQMGETADVTAEMSRIFLGVQLACAQCHDHPTDRWKRQQFHELAAFFPRVGIRPRNDGQMRSFEVVSVDREPRNRGPNNQFRGSTEHFMPDLSDPASKGTLVQPAFFLSGEKLGAGRTDQERRTAAGYMITNPKNKWFAKALVNRLWSELVGEGFYEPVDDIGPDRQASAPATLDYLASQFVLHNHDMKWLFRTITATAAYQRQSRTRRSPDAAPFAANCQQRLRADQVYSALAVALGVPTWENEPLGRGPRAAERSPRGQFNATFGYDPSVRRDEVAGSIPQALLLMNSGDVNRPLNGRTTDTALGKLLAETKNDEAVVVELYLRSLAREPQESELRTCLSYVKKIGNRPEAFEDILWSLVNSTEFLHRK